VIAIGKPLQDLLDAFAQNNGGTQATAYQNLWRALQASDAHMTEYNELAEKV